MELSVRLGPALPRLAWLATIDPAGGRAHVLRGAAVEATERFVVEGAWSGDYQRGGFPRSATFFGSGLSTELVPTRYEGRSPTRARKIRSTRSDLPERILAHPSRPERETAGQNEDAVSDFDRGRWVVKR